MRHPVAPPTAATGCRSRDAHATASRTAAHFSAVTLSRPRHDRAPVLPPGEPLCARGRAPARRPQVREDHVAEAVLVPAASCQVEDAESDSRLLQVVDHLERAPTPIPPAGRASPAGESRRVTAQVLPGD